MKAVVKTRPEPGAEYIEVKDPELRPDWVIVRVRATSICGTDVHIYKWDPWSQSRIGAKNLPQTLGHEVAGEVVEVGQSCRRIKVGDYISAETHIYDPGDLTSLIGIFHVGKNMKILGVDCDGAFAEYFAIPEAVCWKNDPTIPPEFATVQEPLGNATYAVLGEDSDVSGKSMLITGDGPISLFAIGVARACGVARIFHFGKYEFNMAIGKKMGADFQLYTNKTTPEERLQFVMDHTGGDGVDITLEMVGSQDSINDCFRMVRKGGRITAFGIPSESPLPIDYANGIVFKGCQVHGINGRKIFDTWYRNRNLLSSGRLDPSPVITHMFTLADFQKGFEAMMERPRKSAKVVLFPQEEEFQAAMERRKDVR
ncbi:MAG TPA: L-threonine 3-dehydrogenase [bacterium (Candidatus Stahlbacteria)]|nr:L-threonine 3-dehydrogenase [Candidatus Stahlbacteria bacterium]